MGSSSRASSSSLGTSAPRRNSVDRPAFGAHPEEVEVREYMADDRDAVAGSVAILNACRDLETPWMPPVMPYRREMQVRYSWDGTPVRHLLGCADGVPVAVAQLEVGEWDNRDFAWFGLTVHPSHRRRGHGSEMLEVLAAEARSRACTKIGGAGWELEPTQAFAARHGYRLASQAICRVQHPQDLPATLASEVYAESATFASDYDLLRIAGRVPDHLLDPVVTLTAAINDAPTDDLDIEDEVFTSERVRSYEECTTRAGHRLYRIVARHHTSGALGGHTVVAVDEDDDTIAHQHDTSVAREHRGHRLGLLLKADMMRWLSETEPQVQSIYTWNAESNDHMIAVNQRLGYRIAGRELEFQRRLSDRDASAR